MGLATPTTAEFAKKFTTTSGTATGQVVFGNAEERNQIVIQHLPQVHYIAGRIHDRLPHHVPLEDLIQSGVMGLMEALQKYDPSKNVQLKSYAKVRIRGAILDSLREQDWSPRTLRRRARQLDQASHSLRTCLGRSPSDSELAAALGLSLKKFQQLLSDLHGLELVSLQALAREDGHGEDDSRFLPPSGDEDPSRACLRSELHRLLARALGELTPRKRHLLALYYFEELTMKQVGAKLGVGESRVSQIHTATLLRLRARMRQFLESRRSLNPLREKRTPGKGWPEMAPAVTSPPAGRPRLENPARPTIPPLVCHASTTEPGAAQSHESARPRVFPKGYRKEARDQQTPGKGRSSIFEIGARCLLQPVLGLPPHQGAWARRRGRQPDIWSSYRSEARLKTDEGM